MSNNYFKIQSEDSKLAQKYLREYQETYAEITGISLVKNRELAIQISEQLQDRELFEQIKKVHGVSTIEEFIKFYCTPFFIEEDSIRQTCYEIMQANELTDNFNINNLQIGQLPTKDFNASAIRTQNGFRIIVLNSGILGFISAIANLYLGFAVKGLWSSEEAKAKIAKIISYSLSDYTSEETVELPPTFKDLDLIRISGTLQGVSRAIILSHELAHFVLNHINEDSIEQYQLLPNSHLQELDFYVKNQAQELEADIFGVKLCVEWCKISMSDDQEQSAFFAFVFVNHILRLLELNISDFSKNYTHPPANLRRSHFDLVYGYQLSKNSINLIIHLDNFMDSIYYKLKYS